MINEFVEKVRLARKSRLTWEEISKQCWYCRHIKFTNIGPVCKDIDNEKILEYCDEFELGESGYGKFEPFAWPAIILKMKGYSVMYWEYPDEGNFYR